MSGRRTAEREQLELVRRELEARGIRNINIDRTARQHTVVKFWHEGRECRVGFSGSGDWRARRRTRSILRGILEGRRTPQGDIA